MGGSDVHTAQLTIAHLIRENAIAEAGRQPDSQPDNDSTAHYVSRRKRNHLQVELSLSHRRSGRRGESRYPSLSPSRLPSEQKTQIHRVAPRMGFRSSDGPLITKDHCPRFLYC